jgi:tetratricopeptide (TPR) repeat protein
MPGAALERGRADQLCKKIKKEGGAEQYNANKRYTEAVAVAVEKCADDTKGQTCFICTQALHWKTKEGLVRMCACRGTAGFAHVSCLAEQAKILREEAEYNNLDLQPRWNRWYICSLCEQNYHGVVACALGWACWKTYLGRPEADRARRNSINVLGNGLSVVGCHEGALVVQKAELAMEQRHGDTNGVLVVSSNIANTYNSLGRLEPALLLKRDVYSAHLKLSGENNEYTLQAANNYAYSLVELKRFKEAKSVLRKTMSVVRRALGEGHEHMLKMRWSYAMALYKDNAATLDNLREAVATLEEIVRIARQVFGGSHPLVRDIEKSLRDARAALRRRGA